MLSDSRRTSPRMNKVVLCSTTEGTPTLYHKNYKLTKLHLSIADRMPLPFFKSISAGARDEGAHPN